MFGYKRRNERSSTSTTVENDWLNQFSNDQLESLLDELNATLAVNVSNSNGTGAFQSQSQAQEIHAEVHTHKHIYVYYSESGELVALPPFTDSLDNSSLTQIVDMIEAQATGTTPVSANTNNEGKLIRVASF